MALAGCNKTSELTGFKDVNFGLNQTQVEAIGFTCQSKNECQQKSFENSAQSPHHTAAGHTLFGKSVLVRPTLKAGKVNSISVSVNMSSKEVIDLLKAQYGSSKSYDYETLFMGRARTTYWLFDNGTSISLTDTLSDGALAANNILQRQVIGVSDYIENHTYLYYKDKTETNDLLELAKSNTIDPDDI